MRSPGIIAVDPVADPEPGLASGGEGVEIDAFVFQTAPEPLNEDVVHEPPLAVHADADARGAERTREFTAGELGPLVGVKNLGPTMARHRLLERRDAKIGIHAVG